MIYIYSDKYYADLGLHVFPILKYRMLYDKLSNDAGVQTVDFIEPLPASREQLLLVHSVEYLDDLDKCRWTERTRYSELPLSASIIDLFRLASGGTSTAARVALETGCCIHLSGGFHHAFSDRAEGFCYLNDLAVAARVVQQEAIAEHIIIVDCDLHQGNGTAKIFQDDSSVYTFSIHQRDLYPPKEVSDKDIHLPASITDQPYLEHLRNNLPDMIQCFKPDLILYQAGADPYEGDQLGHLSLTINGLKQRDIYVMKLCRNNDIPLAVTLGGGYAYETDDTVQIHFNTCMAAVEVFGSELLREVK